MKNCKKIPLKRDYKQQKMGWKTKKNWIKKGMKKQQKSKHNS